MSFLNPKGLLGGRRGMYTGSGSSMVSRPEFVQAKKNAR